MEKVLCKLCCLSLFLVLILPSLSQAESALVEKNSFAVFTEEFKQDDEICRRAAILVQNTSNCLVKYKIAFGDSTLGSFGDSLLGSGEIKLKGSPQTIKFGKSRLHFGCQIQGNVRITILK